MTNGLIIFVSGVKDILSWNLNGNFEESSGENPAMIINFRLNHHNATAFSLMISLSQNRESLVLI